MSIIFFLNRHRDTFIPSNGLIVPYLLTHTRTQWARDIKIKIVRVRPKEFRFFAEISVSAEILP